MIERIGVIEFWYTSAPRFIVNPPPRRTSFEKITPLTPKEPKMADKTRKTRTENASKETAKPANRDQSTGSGGELHQNAGGTHPPMTAQTGAIISDDEN